MSTKMYNLYRVEEKDIHALFSWLVDLRKQYHAFIREEMKPFVAQKGLDEIVNRMEATTRSRMKGMFNIEANAVIYLHEGKIYVQFFGLRSRFQGELEKESFLINFHYQDQSDQPENIPDAEWNERERIVESILEIDDGARASYCGLSFPIAGVNDVFGLMYGD